MTFLLLFPKLLLLFLKDPLQNSAWWNKPPPRISPPRISPQVIWGGMQISPRGLNRDITVDWYQTSVGTPNESTNGGVLIYARVGINFFPRDDLNKVMYKSKELESFFIEVINPKESNRRPCMNEILFNDDYLKKLNEKLSSEK